MTDPHRRRVSCPRCEGFICLQHDREKLRTRCPHCKQREPFIVQSINIEEQHDEQQSQGRAF